MLKAIRFIGAVCLFVATARAATVDGTLKDPGGAIVPGAHVTLSGSQGGEAKSAVTGPDGQFHFAAVNPGNYTLHIEHDGFEPLERQISVGAQDVTLALSLKIAAQRAEVEVEGGRSRLANADVNYRALRDDQPLKTWHVENFVLKRDVGTLTFRNGTISFLPPVLGRTAVGVFTGDGHFHMDPVLAMEKEHLALITGASAVDEDFDAVLLAFTDGTFEEIVKQAKEAEPCAKDGAALRDFHHELRHRTEEPRSMTEYMFAGESVPNVEAGLLAELYNAKFAGSFSAYIHGRRHAHLRFLVNMSGAIPDLSPEEVALIDLDPGSNEDGIWYLSHLASEWQSGHASSLEDRRAFAVEHYRIETVLGKHDRLAAIADVRFHPLRGGDRVLDFALLPNLRVSRVSMDGKDIGFIQESRHEDGSFFVIMPEAITKGGTYTIRVEYDGNKVVRSEGQGNYAVGARTCWYPASAAFHDRATYDLVFRVPKAFTLVSVGKRVSESREGDFEVTEWKSDVPLAVAGFNYGAFKKKERTDDQTTYDIEAYATEEVPDYLRGAAQQMNLTPAALADSAIVDGMNAIRLYEAWFGPVPYGRLAITQQPEPFYGQSWPGLVYLPLTAFLDATQRWRLMGGNAFRFADFIQEVTPHEVSHQWWGHLVGWASLHDQWLSEGFADFSAGLFLEMTKSKPDEYLHYLERAQKQIVEKNEYGRRANDAGPLWLGLRLDTYKTARAYNNIVYPKGGFVLHMLRYLMQDQKTGDKDFIDMMHDFVATYTNRNASTEDFKAMVEKHMKPVLDLDGNGRMDWFFHEWVYGTDLPSYRLDYSLAPADEGKVMLTATITQSDVGAGFRMRVPVYAEFDGRMVRLGWVPVAGSSTTKEFKAKLPKKPRRVVLCANYDVLASSIINHGN
jgi:Peptidase family M1 domain/Carboxypeptidase regulatory-like domain